MKNRKYFPIDYINIVKDYPLNAQNFHEADIIPFWCFTLIDIDNVGIPKDGESGYITYGDAIAKQQELHGDDKLGLLLPKNINELLIACGQSKRFKDVKLHSLYNKVDDKTQSTFLMADIDEETSIVIFGGTDDTVVGWVEDFDLLVDHNVECLENAKAFVERNCQSNNKKLIFIGHSKGGMESCYALCTASKEIKDRVIVAYDLDGPGFDQEFAFNYLDDPVLDKLKLICPQASFVGRLFFQLVPAIVVKSVDKGLNQHNTSGWLIDGSQFLRANHFSRSATIKSVMAFKYMEHLTDDEKKNFVSGLTKIATAGNSKTLSTLILKPFTVIATAFKLPRAEKRVFLKLPGTLLKSKRKARKDVSKFGKKYGKSNNNKK